MIESYWPWKFFQWIFSYWGSCGILPVPVFPFIIMNSFYEPIQITLKKIWGLFFDGRFILPIILHPIIRNVNSFGGSFFLYRVGILELSWTTMIMWGTFDLLTVTPNDRSLNHLCVFNPTTLQGADLATSLVAFAPPDTIVSPSKPLWTRRWYQMSVIQWSSPPWRRHRIQVSSQLGSFNRYNVSEVHAVVHRWTKCTRGITKMESLVSDFVNWKRFIVQMKLFCVLKCIRLETKEAALCGSNRVRSTSNPFVHNFKLNRGKWVFKSNVPM